MPYATSLNDPAGSRFSRPSATDGADVTVMARAKSVLTMLSFMVRIGLAKIPDPGLAMALA